MSEPFLGEIRMFGFNFAPIGWALCQGQTLSIQQNSALFALLGTTYGGNGTSTFQLPDLRSRVAINQGQGPGLSNYVIGEVTGTENATLSAGNVPPHTHPVNCDDRASSTPRPAGTVPGFSSSNIYSTATPNATMAAGMIGPNTGGPLPFSILQPLLVINFCIALQGIFPSRN